MDARQVVEKRIAETIIAYAVIARNQGKGKVKFICKEEKKETGNENQSFQKEGND